MADYRESKRRITGGFPQKVSKKGAEGFDRSEELLTVQRLKDEFLFGIPLTSPLTKQTMSDDTIKSLIRKCAAEVEAECKVDIFPVQRKVRLEFDRTKHTQGWGQLNLGFSNLLSIEEVSIRTVESRSTQSPGPHPWPNPHIESTETPSPPNSPIHPLPPFGPEDLEDGHLIYKLPLAWIDIDTNGHKGIIYTVPLQTVYTGVGQVGSYNGAASAILMILNQIQWMPGFWFVKWTSGFEENKIPNPINDLIGNKVALRVLSMLGPTQKYNSKNVSIDGVGQGLSGPGVQQFKERKDDLEKQIAAGKDLVRKYFGNSIYMTHF
jgi:hypothetical protein